MAAPALIAELRRLVDEPTTDTYSDVELGDKLDSSAGDVHMAAYLVWTEKAASYASMVNVSESGSSRSMGDMYKNALNLANHHIALSSQSIETRTRSRTRAIERA